MQTTIPVTFSEGALIQSGQPTNSFRLQGKGTVAIDAGTLRIEGTARKSFSFGKAVTLAFPLADVRNVWRHGKAVRFEVPSAIDSTNLGDIKKGTTPFVTVWAADEAAAALFARELGENQTEEFARATRESAEFQERLLEATPRVFVTPALVAINVIVFVAMAFAGAGVMAPEGDVHVRWGSNFGLMTASGEWWRLFTSMFLHFGIIHLALNMAALWDIGKLVERLYGNWTFLLLYLVAGVGGSTLSLLWHPAVNSAGASGAIFGVFGMLAGYLLHKELGVPATVMKAHWKITLPFIAYNLFIGATVPGIDNAAHLGGLAAGFVMGYAAARPLDPAERAFSRKRLAALAVVFVVCIVAAMKPLGSVVDNAGAERGAHEAINSAIRDDKLANDAFKDAINRLEAREIDRETAARKIREESVRRYAESNQRLSSFKLGESSRQASRHQALLLYTALRREGYDLLARAIQTNDDALILKARERIEKSNAVVKALEGGRR